MKIKENFTIEPSNKRNERGEVIYQVYFPSEMPNVKFCLVSTDDNDSGLIYYSPKVIKLMIKEGKIKPVNPRKANLHK